MCGCEACIVPRTLQSSLNAYRHRLNHFLEQKHSQTSGNARTEALLRWHNYKSQAFKPSGAPLHDTPRDAIKCITCLPNSESGLPKWKCVLRQCSNCPGYQIPMEETNPENPSPRISFHTYQKFTRCSRHGNLEVNSKECQQCNDDNLVGKPGKISTRKHLTKKETSIQEFHNQYYLPSLEKYAYHLPHVQVLGKHHCSKLRHDAFLDNPSSLFTKRDYADRLQTAFSMEIQSDHFGKQRSLSMEGSTIEYHLTNLKVQSNNLRNKMTTTEFHSHLADESTQDSATTHEHMKEMINNLKDTVNQLLVMFDQTDGCSKQYRCARALYLLSLLAYQFDIIIDRAIGAPGHGKDIIDALNAIDKIFLRRKFCMIGTPEADDRNCRMAAHSMLNDGVEVSFAEESQRLLQSLDRINGAKSDKKTFKKRTKKCNIKACLLCSRSNQG